MKSKFPNPTPAKPLSEVYFKLSQLSVRLKTGSWKKIIFFLSNTIKLQKVWCAHYFGI